jgi:hypothetical protein
MSELAQNVPTPTMAPSNNPTPPSSTSSNGASPENQQFRVVRKRNRIPLSCAPCRHRKLKCNRGHPCDNCTKRGDTQSCSYATPGNRKKGGAAAGANASPDDMQNRIDRLEGLVLSLMTSGNNGGPSSTAAAQAAIDGSRSNSLSTGSDLRLDIEGVDVIREEGQNGQREDDSEVEQVSKGIGIMKVDNGRAVFASDAHWYAILGEISEVKNYFANHKEDYKQHMQKVQAAKADENPGTAFLLQGPPAKDRAELMAAFPPKTEADRLIARYFNAYDPSVHIIHGPSFQKQYDRHWQAPQESSIVWVGLCFAMMTLALQSYHRAGDEPPEYRGRVQSLSHDFRKLTAQCLLLADITQPIPKILETFILHITAEYGRSRDAEPGVLLMIGICVRLAMRMGYHRDPAPHPQISPFDGEIRRRVWTFIRVTDLLISFQFGLPATIRTDQIDTEHPRNLYDDELHEEIKSLPASRPTFEATPMSYMIAKSKMTFLFGEIVERTQSIRNPPSYEEVMKFDAMLREQRSQHPPLLQMRSFQESARDPANLIMQRLGLEMVFLRSLFVLHRRLIAKGRENARYAYSRRTCIDASMQLLEHQATLHAEGQPGGRLRSVKWYISSLTTHDFLLAAMLVCLDLYHHAEAERRGHKPGSPHSPITTDLYADDRREEMMRAVEHCITIWESVREQSMEAYKGSITLRVMLEKLKAHQRAMQSQSAAGNPLMGHSNFPSSKPSFGAFPNGSVGDFQNTDDLPPEQSAAMTLGMLSSGGVSPGPNYAMSMPQQNLPYPTVGGEKPGYPTSMAALLNEPMPERTGLTPQYSGPEVGQGLSGPASPFSQMLATAAGQNGSFMGMEGLGGDIDWVSYLAAMSLISCVITDLWMQGAWDQYIQGTANNTSSVMDPAQMWPMNVDMGSLSDGGGGGGQPQQQSPPNMQQGNPNGVFMGATTPNMMG